MKKSKIIALSLLSFFGISLCTGNVLAAYAITDNAGTFEITIRTSVTPKTVTFHTPDSADNTCSTFNTTPVEVEYGQTLTDISSSVPNTASFWGFTFSGWYLENTFENSFSNSIAIEDNINLYAKYTRSNVLYDNSVFYVSSNSDQIVDAQYVYKVATQTWGVTPTTNNENRIDLISSSGIYKFSYSSDWTILRKIGLNCKDCNWWGNDGYVSYVFGTTSDQSLDEYGHPWWNSTISTSSVYVDNDQHKTGGVYIDYEQTYLGVIRCNPSNSPVVNASSSDNPTNTTKQTSVAGYNKDQIYLYWHIIPS